MRQIEKDLDKAEQELARLDAVRGQKAGAYGRERLRQAARANERLSSIWTAPPAERLAFRRDWQLKNAIGGATPGFHGTKADGERFIQLSSTEIARYQQLMFANGTKGRRNRIVIILQGMDASGKGSLVKHVFRQGNPMGIHYHGFGAPTEEELSHDFLWRIERELPKPGWISVFDRSQYEDVVMPHVWGTLPPDVWEPRYKRIVDFERGLMADDCAVIKIFLAVSLEKQREHFLGRLDDPAKHWKFDVSDLDARDRWDDYMAAWQEVFERTSTPEAPWHVVPADNRWYSRAVVSELLRTTLKNMNMTWPPLPGNVDVDEVRRRLG